MTHSFPLKHSVIAVATAVSLLAGATSAQAGVVGTFDPLFGGTNSDLANVGFQGTFDLDVSNGCYQANTYVPTGGACTISVNSITVAFYDYTSYTAAHATDPTVTPTQYPYGLSQYTLTPGNGIPAGYVTGAYFGADDRLVGFDTNDSDPFFVNIQCVPGQSCASQVLIQYNGPMLLYFVSGYLDEGVDPAYLVDCNMRYSEENTCTRDNSNNSDPSPVTVTSDPGPTSDPGAIPEPETIPLTLIGLAALAVSGWRKRAASNGRLRRLG